MLWLPLAPCCLFCPPSWRAPPYRHTVRSDSGNEAGQGFLLGCSFSWEDELERAGCVPRHIERKKNVPMFNTSWANQAAGVFEGKLVVSMRPYRPDQLDTVRHITSRYPLSHGGPIHAGDPQVPASPSPCGGVCV